MLFASWEVRIGKNCARGVECRQVVVKTRILTFCQQGELRERKERINELFISLR